MSPRLALLLALLIPAPLAAQTTARVSMDTSVARQLVDAWRRQPGDSLACVAGHVEQDTIVVMDRVTMGWRCGGPGIVGQFGFLANENVADEQAILNGMGVVLERRRELWFSGEIYGALPIPAYGRICWAPRAWWAVRKPAAVVRPEA